MEVEAGNTESAEGIGRNQNVVYTLPHSTESAVRFLAAPLERIDPAAGSVQLIVFTADGDSAAALSEAVLGMTGLAGIELLPVTNAARAGRVLAMRPAVALAGPPAELAVLVSQSRLKLEGVRTVVFAWADLILDESPLASAAIETVMAEISRDAARVLVARQNSPEIESLIERYLRRARRETGAPAGQLATAAVEYVTVSATSRPVVLQRVLDQIDPPSAVVIARPGRSFEEARYALRRLGYHQDTDPIRLSTSEIEANTNTVIYYDSPESSEEVARAVEAKVVRVIALTQPRDLAALRRIAQDVKPLNITTSSDKLRESDERIRAELRAALASGIATREITALEPLLDVHDAMEVAAAALRLLDLERAKSRALAASRPAASAAAEAGGPGATASGTVSLFMTIGSSDGVRAGDIVGAIAGETGLAGSIVGRIDIQDSHSLVEVDAQHAEAVIAKLNGGQLRGRHLVVRLDRPKPPGSRDRGAPRGGPRGDRPSRPDGARERPGGRPPAGRDSRPRGDGPPRGPRQGAGGRDGRSDGPRSGGFRDRPPRSPDRNRSDSAPSRRPPRRDPS